MVTISLVVPTVLDLNTHLVKKQESARHCLPLLRALLASLRKRFRGIFTNCKMAAPLEGVEEDNTPFKDKVYLLAAVLDPRFALHWVDIDVVMERDQERTRAELKRMLQGWSYNNLIRL